MDNNNVMSEVTTILRAWEDEISQPNHNPIPTLTRLSEIIEVETDNYLKMDPDPFDERHPSRSDPDCKFGQILKALFRRETFMNKLVNDYLRDSYFSRLGLTGKDIDQLNIAACRLMLDILPGLETSVVFQPETEGLINRLNKWALESVEPLQSYATGLLAAAMEIAEIATKFREQNARLVPLLLQRLRTLQEKSEFFNSSHNSRPFGHFGKSPKNDIKSSQKNGILSVKRTQDLCNEDIKMENIDLEDSKSKRMKLDNGGFASPPHPTKTPAFNESSNSSWIELENYMIGSIQIYPPNEVTQQVLILRYLTPMGEYQELLSHVFEHNALELILQYVNVRETKKARLGFEALKYLAALLCHKKFCIEFIQYKGLEALLDVPRPSIAATGVSICLYYLGYCEEAMERVCLLPKYIVSNLVKYALWLLECSHDSGRCHATMFFGLTFQFKAILDEFDAQDGLRKLHNVISTLPILLGDNSPLNEDSECAARQIVRHVCVAYKRYLEAHLFAKVEQLRRSQMRPSERVGFGALPTQPSYKPFKCSPDEIQQHIETLFNIMPFRTHWAPVDQLLKLGGITSLLKIIAFAYEWNYSGRGEAVRSALDVLAIACIMPKVQVILCEKVDLPEDAVTIGMSIIIGAAEGEIVVDADVQKSALRVMINCVCGPIFRHGGTLARFSSGATNSPSKKLKVKSSEELIQKMWDCVRSNSGIMVLLQLMNIKSPITDADCIRTLACKSLAGMARCDTVKQIVSKLPIIQNGQLQSLMRDPILQEKRQEHVTFQKYAFELLERLSGNSTKTSNDTDVSLVNIHRASVVAQTKIQFNDKQLMQLIHQHLISKGLLETASALKKEGNLSNSLITLNTNHPSKFRYTAPVTPNRVRLSSYTKDSPVRNISSIHDNQCPASSNGCPGTLQIKLIKKNNSTPQTSIPQNSRLQKQIANEPQMKIMMPGQQIEENNAGDRRITLDSIITEYLTNQHALCKNPMSTCPQFNLFVPHKCPDPKPRIITSNNFALRNARRQMGYHYKNMDRKLIHSRFCPIQTIRTQSEDSFFTCVRFMPGDQSIIVGDYSGEVKCFNLHTGDEEAMFQAHDTYIVNLELNRKGDLLLTSSTWGRPLSGLWSVKDYEMKFALEDEDYVEFSKVTQDRLIGTKGGTATIFDITTGQEIMRLVPTISNQYKKNKATFSLNDELVLSDGVLFDVNSGKPIRKLDKLNQTQNGVFHPNGLEIVSNMEVWDLRTFHLLKTVPALNHCSVLFAPVNNAVYAISLEQEYDDDDTTFDSSFKTIDASDYTSIATIDVRKNIYDLHINKFDSQIAIVENQGMYQSVHESVVRIYDVGRRRDDEDEQDEEEDEEEDDDDDIDASDDDGSDADDANVLDVTNDNNANDNDNAESDPLGLDDSWSDISDDDNGSSVSSGDTLSLSSIDL